MSKGFRRFVAVFVGVLLAAAIVMSVVTGDEGMIASVIAVGLFYAVYLVQFFRKEKEQTGNQKEKNKSPLLRR